MSSSNHLILQNPSFTDREMYFDLEMCYRSPFLNPNFIQPLSLATLSSCAVVQVLKANPQKRGEPVFFPHNRLEADARQGSSSGRCIRAEDGHGIARRRGAFSHFDTRA